MDGAPRKARAVEVEFFRTLPREIQCRRTPPQRIGGRVRRGVSQDGKDETFGVPEGMPVVAGAGEALSRDRPAFGARTGLQHVKEPEPHGLLAVRIAVDLDVGAVPELVEVVTLRVEQALPAGVTRPGDRGRGLVTQRRTGTQARPAVRQVLDDAQAAARAAGHR